MSESIKSSEWEGEIRRLNKVIENLTKVVEKESKQLAILTDPGERREKAEYIAQFLAQIQEVLNLIRGISDPDKN